MKRKTLALYLKLALAVVFVIGVLLFSVVIPDIGKQLVEMKPKFEYLYTPSLIFMWVSAIPVFISMIKVWMIFTDIGKGRSYTFANAKRLQDISRLILADIVLWAAMLLVSIFVELLHPALFLLFMTLFFIGIIAGVVASALSHVVYRYCTAKGEQQTEE